MKLTSDQKWPAVKAYYEKVSGLQFKVRLTDAQIDELYTKMKQFEKSIVDHFQSDPILAEKADHFKPEGIFKDPFSISRSE